MIDRYTFGKMCEDALMERCRKRVEAWDEPIICSRRHYKRMSKILGQNVGPYYKTARRVTAILIAAVLILLSACAAIIYRDKIKGLFVEKHEDRDVVAVQTEEQYPSNRKIEEVYVLSYVPEGFELVEDEILKIRVKYQYKDSVNNIIVYRQLVAYPVGFYDITSSWTGMDLHKRAKCGIICISGIEKGYHNGKGQVQRRNEVANRQVRA